LAMDFPAKKRLNRAGCIHLPSWDFAMSELQEQLSSGRGQLVLLFLLFFAISFSAPCLLPAQQAAPDADPQTIVLEPVVVSATRIPSALEWVPSAVSIVDMEDFRSGKPLVTLKDALERVPGLQVANQQNFAQDLRISIRGFGARSAFGIRGIQILLDGFPLTLPDGQSNLDVIDPEAVERIEVLKGPVAALYGNSSGAVINIITREGSKKPIVEVRTILGEYGLWKTALQGGGETGGLNGFLNLTGFETSGFREHGKAESWKINGKFLFYPDDLSELTLALNAVHSPNLGDPGGLTRAQADEDPRQASPLNLLFNTGEEVSEERAGLRYRRALTSLQNLEAFGFYARRDLENSIPFRFIDLDREVFGGGMKYDIALELPLFPQQLFIGTEIQRQTDDRRNLNNRQGSPGELLLLDQRERVTAWGCYLQDDIRLTKKLSLVVGGRYDLIRFKIRDRLAADGDDSGRRTFDQITGRTGLSWLVRPELQLYVNWAQSYETPTATELVNRPGGGGGINRDIQPQKAANYEIGIKGRSEEKITYSLALYHIRLKDELIAFRDVTDRVFYRNAGRSHRTGVEAGAEIELARGLKFRAAYTYLDAQFDEFAKEGQDLAGNEVPGLPKHQLFGEIFYDHPWGFFAGIDLLYSSSFYVDDENSVKNRSSSVVNVRAGLIKSLGHWRFSPFAGIENLFDESYNNNVRINASGSRYFEPAPGINLFTGIGIGYHW
jgi:iron complex outermembrane recepter protein